MSRLVQHDAVGPAIVKVGDKTLGICQCGLSRTKPFCDGSHKKVTDEKPGVIYLYDLEGHRIVLHDEFPNPKQVFEK